MLWRSLLILVALVPIDSQAQSLSDFFKETFEEQIRDDPEFATNVGRHEQDDRWTDWSKAGREQRLQHLQQRLAKLNAFPSAGVTGQDRLTVRLLQYDFRSQLESAGIQIHLLRVGQLFGFHNRVYASVDRMPARTPRDYQNILARLKALPVYVDRNLAILDESIAQGIMQPRLVVDLVVQQMKAQLQMTPDNSPLLAAFRRFPSNLPTAEQDRLKAQARETYEQAFVPAWRKMLAYMETNYAKHVRPRDSVSSMAGGREAYAVLVRRLTTTNMTPDEIHKLGEDEVKRIETEMQAVIHQAGFNGSIAEFERNLGSSATEHFQSKEEMLAYCRNIAKIIEPSLPNQFKRVPMLLYGVRPIPADREAATATNAQAPSPDYSSPGWFNLNTYEPEKQVKYNKEALVLHEAVPGHIFQITLAQALEGLPAIRRFYGNSAFVEGWALYAESLGSQLGVYVDPKNHFGQLASERFRAVRLVVDTGIHGLGWTREQAIDYFRAHAPDAAISEVDRYISWPAQALSYKMGQLKIRQLRTQAEQKLGAKFDVRDFHDAVLRNGTLPLELLGEQVQEYIKSVH